jgi:hypothetical protein
MGNDFDNGVNQQELDEWPSIRLSLKVKEALPQLWFHEG